MALEHVERIGSRIRARRTELHMTQEAVARAFPGRTTGNQVSRWERGANMPGPQQMEQLASILKVPVSYFMVDAPAEGTADLMEALAAPQRAEQFDRMEAKLDDLAAKLDAILAQLSGDDPPDEPDVDLEDAIAAAEALSQVPRPKRGRDGAAVPPNVPEAPAK